MVGEYRPRHSPTILNNVHSLILQTLLYLEAFIFTILGETKNVRGREVECQPCNHDVPSSSPSSGSQLWDFSLAHTFCTSTGVVPRKQNRERLVLSCWNLFLNRCKMNMFKLKQRMFL